MSESIIRGWRRGAAIMLRVLGAIVGGYLISSALGIVIGGTVRGNLSATTRVEILPTGALTGSLKTGSFMAADGASVKGEVWVEPGSPRGSAAEPRP